MVSRSSTGLPGKKWLSRARLSSSGVEAPGSSGKRRGGRQMANVLAAQMVCGVAITRKSDQCCVIPF